VRETAHIVPPPLYAARCGPSPAHTHLNVLLPVAVGVMNIHDVHDRQTE